MPIASCDARPCAPHRVYGCFMCIGRNRGAGKRDPGVSCVTSTEKGGARLRNPAAGRLQTRPASPLHLQPSCCEGAGARGEAGSYCCVPRSAGCVTQQCRLCLGIAAVQAAPANGRRLCRRHEEHTAAHHASRNIEYRLDNRGHLRNKALRHTGADHCCQLQYHGIQSLHVRTAPTIREGAWRKRVDLLFCELACRREKR
jgi:hypothetical protein